MTTIDRVRRLFAGVGLAAMLTCMVGCGSSGSVEGKVSYRPSGKSLVWGTVVITGRDNIARSGMINPDGSYAVNGVPAGEAVIRVSSDNPKALAQPRAAGGRGGRAGGEEDHRPPDPNLPKDVGGTSAIPEAVLKGWFQIPTKYADPGQSFLKLTVKPGKNQHDIILD
jgi:hypothetical protein